MCFEIIFQVYENRLLDLTSRVSYSVGLRWGLRTCISSKFLDDVDAVDWEQTSWEPTVCRWEGGMRFSIFIKKSVTLQLGILFSSGCTFWTLVCCALCFLKWVYQSAGDKFHYSTFFEFSQGILIIPVLLVLTLFCYFKDLLFFLRWFFLDARECA